MSLELNIVNAILKFLKQGKILEGISIGDKKDKVIRTFGAPDKIIGDDQSGFFQYKSGIRFRYVEDEIDDLGILLVNNKKARFPIQIESLPETKTISRKMLIGELILMLAHAKIKWRSWDEQSINYCTIRTEGDVLILFDLETSKLDRMVYIGENLIRNN